MNDVVDMRAEPQVWHTVGVQVPLDRKVREGRQCHLLLAVFCGAVPRRPAHSRSSESIANKKESNLLLPEDSSSSTQDQQ